MKKVWIFILVAVLILTTIPVGALAQEAAAEDVVPAVIEEESVAEPEAVSTVAPVIAPEATATMEPVVAAPADTETPAAMPEMLIQVQQIPAERAKASYGVTYDTSDYFAAPVDDTAYNTGDAATILDGDRSAHDNSGKHIFMGWTTEKNMHIVSNRNQYDKLIASGTFYTAGNTIVFGSKDIVLYAVFGSFGDPDEPKDEPTFEEGENVKCTFYLTMKGFGGVDVDTIQPTPVNLYVRVGDMGQGSLCVPHGMEQTTRGGYGRPLSAAEYSNDTIVTGGKPDAAQLEKALDALEKKVSTPEETVDFADGTQIYWNVIKYDPSDGWHIDGYVVKPSAVEYANVTYDYGVVGTGSVIGKPVDNPAQVKTGADVPFPMIGANGYEFLGWAYEGNVIDGMKMPAKDITLVAQWKEVKYDVTFAAGADGSFAAEEKTEFTGITYGTLWEKALTPPTPVPDNGYYFAGWSEVFPARVTQTKTYTANFAKQIAVTLTANSKTVDYNGETQTVTGFTGVPKGITVAGLTATGSGKNVQDPRPPYSVIFKGTPVFKDANGNDVTDQYKIAYKTGKLTIRRVPLLVTANNAQKFYGETNPTFQFSTDGLKGIDTAQGIGLNVNYSCAANEVSPAGSSYAIMPSGKTQSVNYDIQYKNGTLDILQSGELGVTATPYGGTYDATEHAGASGVSATVSEGTKITYSVDGVHYVDEIPQFKNAGTYTVYVKAENANYQDAIKELEAVIERAPLTVTADDQSKTEGETDPPLTAVVEGLMGTDSADYTLEREAGETAGNYTIHVSAAENPNYVIATVNGTLTINVVPVVPVPPVDPQPPVGPAETPVDPVIPENPVVPPVTPGTPDTAAPVTPAAQVVTPPAAVNAEQPTITIPEQQVPLAAGTGQDDVTIEDEPTPLASGNGTLGNAHWALLNLILAIATAIVMAVLLIGYFTGKKHKDEEDGQEQKLKRRGIARLLSILPGVGAIVAFLLTEDMSLPMVFTDQWTLLMAVIAVVQAVITFFTYKKHKGEETDIPEIQNV
ncbi:MAG: MBG domain-containing protein [Christensenella sp.]|uniref:MBG domain-containing protein n=1 Tax=Christensenella sp. TaxID=1935934 RepID=UPI002B1E9441|nr:MBG domain-containing protein [Christensenella sp.]MEA5002167.1 MBG domain-containing protein [Christensenella sp.]